jgi:hypothetical protein
MTASSSPKARAGIATTPLLYWLVVVCGLAGVTAARLDAASVTGDLAALWVGSLAGVLLGQIIAFMRLRPWFFLIVALASLWVLPLIVVAFYVVLGSGTETLFLAFVPAVVGGYLSLSERGALVAFWYPAVLWMMVILDRPASANLGELATGATLPFAIGLAALFVAFFRARETRRVMLWRTHASTPLAAPRPPTVLRFSPLRETAQLGWTVLAGAATLVLAAWVAPHLWGKDTQPRLDGASSPPESAMAGACCPRAETGNERVREYFPLVHAHAKDGLSKTCVECSSDFGVVSSELGQEPLARTAWAYSGSPGAGLHTEGSSGSSSTSAPPYEPEWSSPTTSYAPPPWVSEPPPPMPVAEPAPAPKPPPKPVAPPPVARTSAAPPVAPHSPTMAAGQASAVPPSPAAPAASLGEPVPWRWMLALGMSCVGLFVLGRALRRRLTLRHLERPFWHEPLDQRISNHWQRVLIGLRDAGIGPRRGEQPQAFARRVGIEELATCATVLERVRHGVRIDGADLASMEVAATAAYRAGRRRAGVAGRAVGWLRWPLADLREDVPCVTQTHGLADLREDVPCVTQTHGLADYSAR